jgi:hypothetical protein
MTQEQLMKVKIKYLEDRITTMEKSLSRVNNILGRFQMTENQEQGFKDLEDIKDHVSKVKIVGDYELI